MFKDSNEIERLRREIESLKVELEKREESCRESGDSFRKALMANHDAACIISTGDFRIEEVNDKFTRLFGRSRQQVIGESVTDLKLWDDEVQERLILLGTNSKAEEMIFEASTSEPSGKKGRALFSAGFITWNGAESILVYLRSVTRERETENYYRLFAENSTDVIWLLNLSGQFTYVSPSVEKLRGYKPEEVLKQSITDVLTRESAQKVAILLKNLLENESKGIRDTDSHQTEVEQICRDGSTVWTEVITTPIRDENGKIKEILGVSRNIQGKKTAEMKARERSRTVESIFRSSPAGIGMVVGRRFTHVNDRFCDMIGYSRSELVGNSARMIYETDEEYERVGREKYEKIRERGIGDIYTRVVRKDGTSFDVFMSSSPIDAADLNKGVIFNILDLSALKDAEHKLEENEKKFSSFFNHINDALFVHPWKEEGFHNFIEVNDVACRMYGYSREELLRLSPEDLTLKEEIISLSGNKFRSQVVESGSMVFEATQIKKNGDTFPVEISTNLIKLNGSVYAFAVVRDITERKLAEAAVLESQSRYREMFDNSPESMVIIDRMGFVIDCNQAFYRMSGKKPEDIIDKHFSRTNLFSAKKIPEYLRIFSRVLRQKTTQAIEFEWLHEDGSKRSGEAHIGPILNNGKVTALQALVKDITRQKEFEKNLIDAKEQAEENDRLKSSFLETMSHELRTPLNAVIGFSNLINDESDTRTIHELNRYVSDNGKKLLSIIESIFDISLLEADSVKKRATSFSPDELFIELEDSLKGMIELEGKQNINILFQPDRRRSDTLIETDRLRLKQLLSNLLTNAIKYTDRGSIRYGYTLHGDEIEFFVSDTGIGIPEDKTELIFEKFRQLDNSSTRTRGGVGLGLTICNEIAKLLDGTLRVESTPGKGSTFYFRLPLIPQAETFKNRYGIDLRDRTLLIVEDAESNFLYLEKLLTTSGASVLWAKTGEEAVSLFSSIDSIDMVLMDIKMPDIDGYEITRRIKKIRPEVPVIAQTAYAMKSDQEEALDAGCSAHISKPIRIEDLRNTIREYLPGRELRKIVL